MTTCWKCLKMISSEPIRIGFKDYCPHCITDQHVCKNCKHFDPNKHNQCNERQAEWVKDRDVRNLCEYFSVKEDANTQKPHTPPNKFQSLFKDD